MGWLLDLFDRFDRDPERRPFDQDETSSGQPLDLSERERLMRHTGRPECPILEHAEALRRLGRVIQERDAARAQVAQLERTVEYLQCRLRHPARGEAA